MKAEGGAKSDADAATFPNSAGCAGVLVATEGSPSAGDVDTTGRDPDGSEVILVTGSIPSGANGPAKVLPAAVKFSDVGTGLSGGATKDLSWLVVTMPSFSLTALSSSPSSTGNNDKVSTWGSDLRSGGTRGWRRRSRVRC